MATGVAPPMAMPLGTAAMYSLAPPLAAYLAALVLMQPVREGMKASPAMRSLGLVVHLVPLAAPMFGLAAAFLATTSSAEPTVPLLVLGCVGAVVCLVQGLVARTGFDRVVKDQAGQFGPLMIKMVLPETLVMFALVWVVLSTAGGL